MDWLKLSTHSLLAPLLLAFMPVIGAPQAPAAQGPWSVSVAGTTNYIVRGVQQAYDSLALQLGTNYQSPVGWFAGIWGSNVQPYLFGASALEVDLYGGWRHPLGELVNVAATYTHYDYLNDRRPGRYDYDELSLSTSYLDYVTASVSYQPDSTLYAEQGLVRRRANLAYELSGRWPLPAVGSRSDRWALVASAGEYDLQRLFGVSYWAADAGAQYVYRRLSVEVAHFFVDSTVQRLFPGASANGTWVLSVVYRY